MRLMHGRQGPNPGWWQRQCIRRLLVNLARSGWSAALALSPGLVLRTRPRAATERFPRQRVTATEGGGQTGGAPAFPTGGSGSERGQIIHWTLSAVREQPLRQRKSVTNRAILLWYVCGRGTSGRWVRRGAPRSAASVVVQGHGAEEVGAS